MKIHNYGNDYVQASKFKKESVSNAENQTTDNRPEPSEPLSAETAEEQAEAKETHQGRKKKQSD